MAGNQAFTLGTGTGVGRLWEVNVGSNTHIRGNINNAAGRELKIIVEDLAVSHLAYANADYAL